MAVRPTPPLTPLSQWCAIAMKADAPKSTAEVKIYADIGADPWMGTGVDAKEFSDALDKLDVDQIDLRLNSRGGLVWDGIAIMNALARHPANVTVYIDALAASAASFIAMAGDEVVINDHAEMMIHDALGVAVGNAADMKNMLDRLDQMSDNVAGIYAKKAGGDVKDWRKKMSAETWYSADEAVAAGLADRKESTGVNADDLKATMSAQQVFRYSGRQAAPGPKMTGSDSAPTGAGTHEGNGPNMADNLNEAVATALGVAIDADEATVLAAVEALKTTPPAGGEDAPEGTVAGAPGVPTVPTPADIAAAAKAAGLVMVDETQFAQMKANSEAGAAAHARQIQDDNIRMVDAAIGDGRIPPSKRADYLKNLGLDRDTWSSVIENLAPGTAVNMTESGVGAQMSGDVQVPDDLSWFDTAPSAPTQKEN